MGSIINKPDRGTNLNQSRHSTLKIAGMRVTNQRALILEIIREGQGHLDADEIHRRARARQPHLSLSTVYRTLKALKGPGMIEELHFNDTHRHYEVKTASRHHHLVCLGCGRVVEFEYPISSYVKRKVAEAKDFEIVDTELRMTGYCPQCRPKR